MNMKSIACAALGGIAMAGCATTPAERVDEAVLAKLNTFEPTGQVTNCLPNSSRNISIQAATENQLLIRVGPNRWYLNETRGRCSGATSTFNRFQYVLRGGSQLCSLQIVNIVDNTTNQLTGSCSLGEFQELKPIEEEDASES